MEENKDYTREFEIVFNRMPSVVDLQIFYRIIQKCNLAEIKNKDVSKLIGEDLKDRVMRYRFIVHDPYDLRLAEEMIHKLLPPHKMKCRMAIIDGQKKNAR